MADQPQPLNLTLKTTYKALAGVIRDLNNEGQGPNGATIFSTHFKKPTFDTLTVSYDLQATDQPTNNKIGPLQVYFLLQQAIGALRDQHGEAVANRLPKERQHLAELQALSTKLLSSADPKKLDPVKLTETFQRNIIDQAYNIIVEDYQPEKAEEPTYKHLLGELRTQINRKDIKNGPLQAWPTRPGVAQLLSEFITQIQNSDIKQIHFIENVAPEPISVKEAKTVFNEFAKAIDELRQAISEKSNKSEDEIKFLQAYSALNPELRRNVTDWAKSKPFVGEIGDDAVLVGENTASESDLQTALEYQETYQKLIDVLEKTKPAAEPPAPAPEETDDQGGDEDEEEEEEQQQNQFESVDALLATIQAQAIERVLQQLDDWNTELLNELQLAPQEQTRVRKEIKQLLEGEFSSFIKDDNLRQLLTEQTIPNRDDVVLFDSDRGQVAINDETQAYIEQVTKWTTQALANAVQNAKRAIFEQVTARLKTYHDLVQRVSGNPIAEKEFRAIVLQTIEFSLREQLPELNELLEQVESLDPGKNPYVVEATREILRLLGLIAEDNPVTNDLTSPAGLRSTFGAYPYQLYRKQTNSFVFDEDMYRKWVDAVVPTLIKRLQQTDQVIRLTAEIKRTLQLAEELKTETPQPKSQAEKLEILSEKADAVEADMLAYRQEAIRLQTIAINQFLIAQGIEPGDLSPDELAQLHPFAAAALQDILMGYSPEELHNPATRMKIMRQLYFRLRSRPEFIETLNQVIERKKIDRSTLITDSNRAVQTLDQLTEELPPDAFSPVSATITNENYVSELTDAFAVIFPDATDRQLKLNNVYTTIDSLIALNYSPDMLEALTPGRCQMMFGFKLSQQELNQLIPLLKAYWVIRRETILRQNESAKENEKAEEQFAAEQLGNETRTLAEYSDRNFATHIQPMMEVRNTGSQDILDAALLDEERLLAIQDQKRRSKIEYIRARLIEQMLADADAQERQRLMDELNLSADAQLQASAVGASALALSSYQNEAVFGPQPKPSRFAQLRNRFSRFLPGGKKAKLIGSARVSGLMERGATDLVTTGLGRGLDFVLPGLGVATQSLMKVVPQRYRKYVLGSVVALITAFVAKTIELFLTTAGGFIGGIVGGIAGTIGLGPGLGTAVGFTGGVYTGYAIEQGFRNSDVGRFLGLDPAPADTGLGNLFSGAGQTTGGTSVASVLTGPTGIALATGTAFTLTTMVMLNSNVQPLPTESSLHEGQSKYVEVTKVMDVDDKIEDPQFDVNVKYQIAIKPKGTYQIIIPLASFSDSYTVQHNREEYDDNPPEVNMDDRFKSFEDFFVDTCNSGEDFPTLDAYKNALIEANLMTPDGATLIISNEALTAAGLDQIVLPAYCETFGSEFNHAAVINTVEFELRAFDPEQGGEIEENVRAPLRLCLGNCPSGLTEGCWPTTGSVVQEPYGKEYCEYRRNNEGVFTHCNGGVAGGGYWPDAFDVLAGKNVPVYAVEGGEVMTSKYYSDSWGNYVVVKGDSGSDILYAHFVQPSELNIGDRVEIGQQIGTQGNTGASDGIHLHFELRKNASQGGTGTVYLRNGDSDGTAILRTIYIQPNPDGTFPRLDGVGSNARITEDQVCRQN